MTALPILNLQKENVGEVQVAEKIVATSYNEQVVHQTVVHYLAGLRQGTHSTKNVATVSGSGSKPWKQKGTGRARAGSVKSPVWRHGGVVFGPQPRSHAKNINKKVRRHALRCALAKKISEESVSIVESLELASHKTKDLHQTLKTLGCENVLIVSEKTNLNLELSAKNLPQVLVCSPQQLNVYNLLKYKKVLLSKEALAEVEKRVLS